MAWIVVEGHIGANDVGSRGLDGEDYWREILAEVGIALISRDLGADLVERS